jgi:hypothetical protein
VLGSFDCTGIGVLLGVRAGESSNSELKTLNTTDSSFSTWTRMVIPLFDIDNGVLFPAVLTMILQGSPQCDWMRLNEHLKNRTKHVDSLIAGGRLDRDHCLPPCCVLQGDQDSTAECVCGGHLVGFLFVCSIWIPQCMVLVCVDLQRFLVCGGWQHSIHAVSSATQEDSSPLDTFRTSAACLWSKYAHHQDKSQVLLVVAKLVSAPRRSCDEL